MYGTMVNSEGNSCLNFFFATWAFLEDFFFLSFSSSLDSPSLELSFLRFLEAGPALATFSEENGADDEHGVVAFEVIGVFAELFLIKAGLSVFLPLFLGLGLALGLGLERLATNLIKCEVSNRVKTI